MYDFKITSFQKTKDNYVLKFEENPNAIKYNVIISDDDGNELYNNEFKENNIKFEDLFLKHDKNINITVIAIDKNDVKKKK